MRGLANWIEWRMKRLPNTVPAALVNYEALR
jgi:hypothetical protein